jgi:cytochrome c
MIEHGNLVLIVLLTSMVPAFADLRGHGGPVRSVATEPSSHAALTGSFDGSAILWDVSSGEARQALRFHAGQVNATAFLSQTRFITAGQDGLVALWTAAREQPDRVLDGHAGPVVALAVAEDGRIASASWDGTVRLWAGDGSPLSVLRGHAGNVNAVGFLPGGDVVSAGADGTVRVWASGRESGWVIFASPAAINAAAVLGGAVALAGADGSIRLIDASGRNLGEARLLDAPATALAASGDGLLAAGGADGSVALLQAPSLRVIRSFAPAQGPVWALAFLASPPRLLAGTSRGPVVTWDLASGARLLDGSDGGQAAAATTGGESARVFAPCRACHSLGPDHGNRAGPTLYGLFGRRAGTANGYVYSAALGHRDLMWTAETVARLFEIGPAAFIPGTKMPDQKLVDERDRADLIRFLEEATKPR